MMLTVETRDEITPLVKRYLENNPQMIRSLAKSVGWFTQKEIKSLISKGELPSDWKQRSPYEIRRKLDNKAPKKWLGKLQRTIAYQSKSDGEVDIGWASRSAAVIGRLQEEGAERTVTPALRSFFASKGVPLGENKKDIKLPARPIYELAMQRVQPKIGMFINERVAKYIQNSGFVRNVGKGRKYEVFR